MFADDTTFQLQNSNLSDLFNIANAELEKAKNWFQANKLTLNVSKTKFILFRSKSMHVDFNDLELFIGNEKIERIGDNCKDKYFKFVGHRLDEHLTWEHQINHVHSKLASANYAISQIKNFVSKKIRMTLYNSLFRPHMEFGILAWGGINKTKLSKIINLQKKCLRNVAGKQYRSHTNPIFSKLGILKFNDMLHYNSSIFMHNFINDKLPNSFRNFFEPLSFSGQNFLQLHYFGLSLLITHV